MDILVDTLFVHII